MSHHEMDISRRQFHHSTYAIDDPQRIPNRSIPSLSSHASRMDSDNNVAPNDLAPNAIQTQISSSQPETDQKPPNIYSEMAYLESDDLEYRDEDTVAANDQNSSYQTIATPIFTKPKTPSSHSHYVTEIGNIFAASVFQGHNEDKPTKHKQTTNKFSPPHVTIKETQKYTFAIVLKNYDQLLSLLRKRCPTKSIDWIRQEMHRQMPLLQCKCVRRLVQAGLGVLILDNACEESDKKLNQRNFCILIDAKKDPLLLFYEYKREMDEVNIQNGKGLASIGEESLPNHQSMCFSPALELQLTQNIIQNAFREYDKDEWVLFCQKELTLSDIVQDIFPLHDRTFNAHFFAEYRKQTVAFGLENTMNGNRNRWAVEELRLHFGERVAFLFAFMHIYTKLLMPMMICTCSYYLFMRFFSGYVWRQYLQGLAVIGASVCCIWAPIFLLFWERETQLLVEKWNLTRYTNTIFEKNNVNPHFQFVWERNELTHEMEKVPKKRNTYGIQVTMLLYVSISAIIQCVCLLPFIQWYVYAKQAPTCAVCQVSNDLNYQCLWFVTCFTSESSSLGTDRWFYILCQGILLGLLIDIIFFELFTWISEKFVHYENFATKSEFENRLIHRRFVFVWSNWFFWFLFLSFVYMPFGKQFTKALKKTPLKYLAPYDFDPTLLTLDTLFVTPLVVTQFLNMLLETILPYLVRTIRKRPLSCRKWDWLYEIVSERTQSFHAKWRKSETKRAARVHAKHSVLTAKKLSAIVQRKTGVMISVLPISDDSNQYTAYEILAESKLPIFDPTYDYLDACIQFSYVVMFTVVWPLLPLPAFINNLLEVRGDAFRLLFAHRRPMPRRDTSIGEWATILLYANTIGITVVMALIAIYHLGYFLTNCNFRFTQGRVVPFSTIHVADTLNPIQCERESGHDREQFMFKEIVMFVILEHAGYCIKYLILQWEKKPSRIRSSEYQRKKEIENLTCTRAASAVQLKYVCTLKALFEKYDSLGEGYLSESELISFLAEWICRHPSELLPYSSTIFRYMDKCGIGIVPFATCCLMLQNVHQDRFFACLLGIYDPFQGKMNEKMQGASNDMELRECMTRGVSERVSCESEKESMCVVGERLRDSSFYIAP